MSSKRWLLVSIPCLAMSCHASSEPGDDAELDAELAAADDDEGPARVSNGDGTWSYALDDGFDPSARVKRGALTWRYAGQARYSDHPTRGAERTFTVAEPSSDPFATIHGVRRIDRRGRIWVVDALEDEAATRLRDVRAAAPTRDEPVGTQIRWKPTSWDHENCDGQGGVFEGNDFHMWDGDGRVADQTPEGPEVTAVSLWIDQGLECTGTILRTGNPSYVLTAAHCVSDDDNNPIPHGNGQVEVCYDPDLWECFTVDEITLAPNYGGGSGDGGGFDPGDDWALLVLEDDIPVRVPDEEDHMHISTVADSVLESLTNVYNLAFPEWTANCGSGNGFTVYTNREMEPIAEVTNKRLKLKIDGTNGHSGGPIYYCPAGDNNVCSSGDMAHIIGVMSGWNSVSNRFLAAKVSAFAAELELLMD